MKRPKFLVSLDFKKTLLIPRFGTSAIFSGKILRIFGRKEVDAENVWNSVEGGN